MKPPARPVRVFPVQSSPVHVSCLCLVVACRAGYVAVVLLLCMCFALAFAFVFRLSVAWVRQICWRAEEGVSSSCFVLSMFVFVWSMVVLLSCWVEVLHSLAAFGLKLLPSQASKPPIAQCCLRPSWFALVGLWSRWCWLPW